MCNGLVFPHSFAQPLVCGNPRCNELCALFSPPNTPSLIWFISEWTPVSRSFWPSLNPQTNCSVPHVHSQWGKRKLFVFFNDENCQMHLFKPLLELFFAVHQFARMRLGCNALTAQMTNMHSVRNLMETICLRFVQTNWAEFLDRSDLPPNPNKR